MCAKIRSLFAIITMIYIIEKGCVDDCSDVSFTGDVEIDIQNLYKAVPQLNEVFHIIDKIGEGTRSE